mmetsp:Transcript_12081/g.18280  ORF Transcript_12081/g.18280 Transcript_12081/m.18280 type:complete len:157 (-) Transcript_12081:48-518(-)
MFYTNGECLGVYYNQQLSKELFKGFAGDGIFQVFSLDSGLLLDEQSISSSRTVGSSACFSNEKNVVWMVQEQTGAIYKHRLRPSPRMYRLRMKKKAKLAGNTNDHFSMQAQLAEKYPLVADDAASSSSTNNALTSASSSSSSSSSYLFDGLKNLSS